MTELSSADPFIRRREAGDFLRSRRERLSPADVGLPSGVRRRTRGLRREEVAYLAGVGTTWYTWLEQGRDVRPSNELLMALAQALRLDPIERGHLFALNDRPAPARRVEGPELIGGPLRRMLDSLVGQPAYVLGRRWDILAWNRAANLIYGPYERLQDDERNALQLLFTDPAHRRLLVDWEPVARASLAMFRADYARHAGDPDFERLITHLAQRSPEFADFWAQREVAHPLPGHKRLDHPACGRMDFEFSSFEVADLPGAKLIVFTPLEAEDSVRKLDRLLRDCRDGSCTKSR